MSNNHPPQAINFQDALRRHQSNAVDLDSAFGADLRDMLQPPTAEPTSGPVATSETRQDDGVSRPDNTHQFEDLPTTTHNASNTPSTIEAKLRGMMAPEYDLGISPADLRQQHGDPESPLNIIAADIDERLATGNHVFTPTEGSAFVVPPDTKPKEIVLRAPHEIDFQGVEAEVTAAYEQINAFDVRAAKVVEAERLHAMESFQNAVDALFNLQGAEAWSENGKHASVELKTVIAERFVEFSAKRQAAWEALEIANSIKGSIEMSSNQLRNLAANGEALNRKLAHSQQDDRDNNSKFGVLVSRFQEVQQTIRVNPRTAYFQESDIETFNLRAYITSPQQQANFDQTMRILLAGVPEGTPDTAPEAVRLQSAWSNVREVIAHQKPEIQQVLLTKSKELAESIEATRAYIETNDANIAAEKLKIEALKAEQQMHLTQEYEPALKAMTAALAALEEMTRLAYVRSTQVTAVTSQLEAAKRREIEQRRTQEENDRQRTLDAIAYQENGEKNDARVSEDTRQFPTPESRESKISRWKIIDKIVHLGTAITKK